jgi:hypothetical protein
MSEPEEKPDATYILNQDASSLIKVELIRTALNLIAMERQSPSLWEGEGDASLIQSARSFLKSWLDVSHPSFDLKKL